MSLGKKCDHCITEPWIYLFFGGIIFGNVGWGITEPKLLLNEFGHLLFVCTGTSCGFGRQGYGHQPPEVDLQGFQQHSRSTTLTVLLVLLCDVENLQIKDLELKPWDSKWKVIADSGPPCLSVKILQPSICQRIPAFPWLKLAKNWGLEKTRRFRFLILKSVVLDRFMVSSYLFSGLSPAKPWQSMRGTVRNSQNSKVTF